MRRKKTEKRRVSWKKGFKSASIYYIITSSGVFSLTFFFGYLSPLYVSKILNMGTVFRNFLHFFFFCRRHNDRDTVVFFSQTLIYHSSFAASIHTDTAWSPKKAGPIEKSVQSEREEMRVVWVEATNGGRMNTGISRDSSRQQESGISDYIYIYATIFRVFGNKKKYILGCTKWPKTSSHTLTCVPLLAFWLGSRKHPCWALLAFYDVFIGLLYFFGKKFSVFFCHTFHCEQEIAFSPWEEK